MLYTPLTKHALRMCFEAHAGQLDKSGIPYVHHPLHLAERMRTEDEVCAALLHDVMEDCGRTPDDLRAAGIPERVVEALKLLTHESGVSYLNYVRALKDNEIARKVKVADLRHNSELSRLDTVSDRDLLRLRKYMEARVTLGDMTYVLPTPVGPLTVAVNGEPYPFSCMDESHDPIAYYEQEKSGTTGQADGLVVGRVDRVYRIEVETLPLQVGDRIAITCDHGNNVVDWGSDEHVEYRVYARNGYTIGLGFYNDESDIDGGGHHPYRLDHSSDSYEIVEQPSDFRFHHHLHCPLIRIAWKAGETEEVVRIVGWVAGL